METTAFWERRAQQFAGEGAGLRAVCSYAMPRFYNWSIDVTQRRALKSFLDSVDPGSEVLEFGCGIGRWTRELARRGAVVTAIDFSATMLAQAQERTRRAGLADRCRFVEADIADCSLPRRYDAIFGVTVLQHVLEDEQRARIIARFARALKPGGRLLLVEAMPTQDNVRCNTRTFRAHPLAWYVATLEAAGLRIQEVAGIDPAPLKLWVVPRFQSWPRMVGLTVLAAATLLSLPVDLFLARRLTRFSWHKLVLATAPADHS